MERKKIVAIVLAIIVIASSLAFLSLNPHTDTIYSSSGQMNIKAQFFGNYSKSLANLNFSLENLSRGSIRVFAYVHIYPVYEFILSNQSYNPPINISLNSTYINYGPMFALESVFYPPSSLPLSNVSRYTYGGLNGNISIVKSYDIVSTSFGSILTGGVGFTLYTPWMNVTSGNYDLNLSLAMKSLVPYYNSTFSTITWKLSFSNVTMVEGMNGYLFNSNPTVKQVNL